MPALSENTYHLPLLSSALTQTVTATEFSKLHGLTASTDELNKLDGVTSTTAQLNFTNNLSSDIQTQLNAKQATITGAATTIDTENLDVSRASLILWQSSGECCNLR